MVSSQAKVQPVGEEECSKIGPYYSWRDQQKNIRAFVDVRTIRSEYIPRLLLAQFDGEVVTVYQAYNPSIGKQAVLQGDFTDSEFSFSRVSWIKPNFSWMMHRSGWASKRNQEAILAIRLYRAYFDELLAQAVPTSWDDTLYTSAKEWSQALKEADVLVQWDPDHHLLSGRKLPYKVAQLGIRRAALDGFKGPGIESIADISMYVQDVRKDVLSRPVEDPDSCHVDTPLERRYPVPGVVQAQQRIT